ncbi:unnamed protein product [Closterium sp. Yama58-4]|nr:unnamed protein product [Closterium sp. Yama58-4]
MCGSPLAASHLPSFISPPCSLPFPISPPQLHRILTCAARHSLQVTYLPSSPPPAPSPSPPRLLSSTVSSHVRLATRCKSPTFLHLPPLLPPLPHLASSAPPYPHMCGSPLAASHLPSFISPPCSLPFPISPPQLHRILTCAARHSLQVTYLPSSPPPAPSPSPPRLLSSTVSSHVRLATRCKSPTFLHLPPLLPPLPHLASSAPPYPHMCGSPLAASHLPSFISPPCSLPFPISPPQLHRILTCAARHSLQVTYLPSSPPPAPSPSPSRLLSSTVSSHVRLATRCKSPTFLHLPPLLPPLPHLASSAPPYPHMCGSPLAASHLPSFISPPCSLPFPISPPQLHRILTCAARHSLQVTYLPSSPPPAPSPSPSRLLSSTVSSHVRLATRCRSPTFLHLPHLLPPLPHLASSAPPYPHMCGSPLAASHLPSFISPTCSLPFPISPPQLHRILTCAARHSLQVTYLPSSPPPAPSPSPSRLLSFTVSSHVRLATRCKSPTFLHLPPLLPPLPHLASSAPPYPHMCGSPLAASHLPSFISPPCSLPFPISPPQLHRILTCAARHSLQVTYLPSSPPPAPSPSPSRLLSSTVSSHVRLSTCCKSPSTTPFLPSLSPSPTNV